jgi:hypothetical protein
VKPNPVFRVQKYVGKTAFRFAAIVLAAAATCRAEWVRVVSPHFELYTSAGQAAGADAIRYFEWVRVFFVHASPLRNTTNKPVRIVLFRSAEDYRPYSPSAANIAYYAQTHRRDYIVMRDERAGRDPVAIHEFTHLMIAQQGWNLPVWLGEGWADVNSTLRRTGPDKVLIGDLIPGRVETLRTSGWIPLATLTSATDTSPLYTGPRAQMFYSESWALVHMLYLSPNYGPGFGPFVLALARGKSFSRACETAFHRTPYEVERDLHAYLESRQLYGLTFTVNFSAASTAVRITPLTRFDADLGLADLLAAVHHFAAAKSAYRWLALRYPDRVEVEESLGYLAWSMGNLAAARSHFAAALERGTRDSAMCVDYARLLRLAHDRPGARMALERAVSLDPGNRQARQELAQLSPRRAD